MKYAHQVVVPVVSQFKKLAPWALLLALANGCSGANSGDGEITPPRASLEVPAQDTDDPGAPLPIAPPSPFFPPPPVGQIPPGSDDPPPITAWPGPLACPLNTYSANYCEEIEPDSPQNMRLVWWDHFPLKVYFQSAPVVQGEDLNTIVMAGFNHWSSVSGHALATQVMSAAEADVTVSYDTSGTSYWLGRARIGFMPSTMQVLSGSIEIRLDPGISRAAVVDGIRATAQHEFGHVIFLNGHSSNEFDSMYPYGSPTEYRGLSERDANSLKTVYCGGFNGGTGTRSRPYSAMNLDGSLAYPELPTFTTIED